MQVTAVQRFSFFRRLFYIESRHSFCRVFSLSELLFRGGYFIRFDFDLLRNIEDAFYFLS